MMVDPLVKISGLKKIYSPKTSPIIAIENVSLDIFPGEILGLVGESGCGKSTVGRCILRLVEPTSGTICFAKQPILSLKRDKLKTFRKEVGIIFQDPSASLNPRMTVENILAEPLEIHGICKGVEKKKKILSLLSLVGLPPESISRFPHEFSGGQKQRIGIARALAVEPRFIICDEAISALDVSVQAQIINLLKQLRDEIGLTLLFIAHDLRVVKYLSDRIAVMYLGHIVEIAPSDLLYALPLHPYTQALLSAIPIPDPAIERNRERIVLEGEIPSAASPPKGCPFVTRCRFAHPKCHAEKPPLVEVAPKHYVACHLVLPPSSLTKETSSQKQI